MLYNTIMKKKFAYFAMSLSFSLSLVAMPVYVRALSGSDSNNTTTTTTSTTATTDPQKETENEAELETEKSTTEAPETTEVKTARETRVGDYKKLLKETMTTALKARISSKCVPAQALLKTKSNKNSAKTKVRTDAYDKIVTELETLSTSVAAKGADVTALQASITTLKANIATFKAANTVYQLALADIAALDCKTDPTAFKAALEVARTNQIVVFNAAKTIRTQLTATVKPALELIKTSLEAKKDN